MANYGNTIKQALKKKELLVGQNRMIYIFIDDVVGNFNSKEVYNNTVGQSVGLIQNIIQKLL